MKDKYSDQLATFALKALLYEVNISPKPGLVDRFNNGAHTDMDSFLFIDSSLELYSYFKAITLKGQTHKGDISTILAKLRKIGLEAEEKMLAITGGINTHKGVIFSLGLTLAVAGYMESNNIALTLESLFSQVSLAAATAKAELGGNANTYGEKSYNNYGITGVRGEAAGGYPSVVKLAYPALTSHLNLGHNLNDSAVATLLNLIAVVEDTNIIGRAGLDTLRQIQEEAGFFLAQPYSASELLKFANKLDRRFITLNISPGGSADLLALTLFVYFLLN